MITKTTVNFSNGKNNGIAVGVFFNTLQINSVNSSKKRAIGEFVVAEDNASSVELVFHKSKSIDILIEDLKKVKEFIISVEEMKKKTTLKKKKKK